MHTRPLPYCGPTHEHRSRLAARTGPRNHPEPSIRLLPTSLIPFNRYSKRWYRQRDANSSSPNRSRISSSHCPRQGARYLRTLRRSASLRRQRPHLRLRPCPGQRDPRQRQHPHPALSLLVRLPQDHRPEPSHHRRCRAVSRTTAAHISSQLDGRSMLVKRAKMFPVECVVRGYLSGSGWKDYQQTGAICGIKLPPACANPIACPNPSLRPPPRSTPVATTKTSRIKQWNKPSAQAHADALRDPHPRHLRQSRANMQPAKA